MAQMTAVTRARRAWECRLARLRMAGAGAGGEHVGACLACQVELARRRSLQRELDALGSVTVTAPPGLLDEVLAGIDSRDAGSPEVSATSSSRRWGVAGMSSLAAAALTGVVVTIARRRARPA